MSVQAATNGVHASFVIPTCTRGMKEGWKAGGLTREEEEEENFSAILFFFFLVIAHLIDQYTSE